MSGIGHFISEKFQQQVWVYVKSNLNLIGVTQDVLGVRATLYSEVVERKIEKICTDWFENILKKATLRDHYTVIIESSSTNPGICLDEKGWRLIKEIFYEKLKLFHVQDILVPWEKAQPNSLLPGLLPKGDKFRFQLAWLPDNEFLKPAPRLYQPIENETGVEHYEMAKKGNGTDVTLQTREGDLIPVHSLYLISKSPYFRGALNGKFQESQTKKIHLPYTKRAIENMVQFLYLQTIEEKLQSDLKGLIELYQLADAFQIERLKNFVSDLLTDLFDKKFFFDREEMMVAIPVACLHKMSNLLVCLLKTGGDKIDWSRIDGDCLSDLFFFLADQGGFQKIREKVSGEIGTRFKRLSLEEQKE